MKELDRCIGDIIEFRGHENILARHGNTIEVTKDEEVSKRGDCIVGVDATKGCEDLNPLLKHYIRGSGLLSFAIVVGKLRFSFLGRGSTALELTHPRELVLRKSNFASPRTAAVLCDAAAIDIPRNIIQKLQNPNTVGSLCITAIDESQTTASSNPMLQIV